MKMRVIFIMLLPVLGFILLVSDPVNRLMLTNIQGEVKSGTILDITVGGRVDYAQQRLSHLGFRLTSRPSSGSCLGYRSVEDQSIYRYVSDDWRNGVICIFGDNDNVTSIAWGFSPIAF